jgi:hypothetical protein
MPLYDPEPGANSYGTPEGVAALARTWTRDGDWLDPVEPAEAGTNPKLTTVVNWIDQISAILNASLAKYGFTIPITQADAKLNCDGIVEQLVSDMAQYANMTGRFFSQRFIDSGYSVWRTIRGDIDAWVNMYASGLEELGAERSGTPGDQIGYRDSDASGEATFPIFQRRQHGNVFDNWSGNG